MKRYALLAIGPSKELQRLHDSLLKNGCIVGDSVLASFGDFFGAAMEVFARDNKAVSSAARVLKGTVTLKSKALPMDGKRQTDLANAVVTMQGQNRPEALSRLCALVREAGAEVTGMETKALAEGSLLAVAAEVCCQDKAAMRKLHSGVKALAKALGISARATRIELEEIL